MQVTLGTTQSLSRLSRDGSSLLCLVSILLCGRVGEGYHRTPRADTHLQRGQGELYTLSFCAYTSSRALPTMAWSDCHRAGYICPEVWYL